MASQVSVNGPNGCNGGSADYPCRQTPQGNQGPISNHFCDLHICPCLGTTRWAPRPGDKNMNVCTGNHTNKWCHGQGLEHYRFEHYRCEDAHE